VQCRAEQFNAIISMDRNSADSMILRSRMDRGTAAICTQS
jgi:hypothetical protein